MYMKSPRCIGQHVQNDFKYKKKKGILLPMPHLDINKQGYVLNKIYRFIPKIQC